VIVRAVGALAEQCGTRPGTYSPTEQAAALEATSRPGDRTATRAPVVECHAFRCLDDEARGGVEPADLGMRVPP